MQRKKVFWLAAVAVAALIVVLILCFLKKEVEEEQRKQGITREEAARALALLVSEEDVVAERASKGGYLEYLETEGFFLTQDAWEEEGKTKEDRDILFLGEWEHFLEKAGFFPEPMERRMAVKFGDVPVEKKEFWRIYEYLIQQEEMPIEKRKGVAAAFDQEYLYLKEERLRAFDYDFEDALDKEITYFAKNDVFVGLFHQEKSSFSYENVLVTGCDEEVTIFLYGGFRNFKLPGKDSLYQDAVLDLTVEESAVTAVSVKSQEIRAKVLAAGEDFVELEGYGEIPMDENFHMYKGYGAYERAEKKDICVGYDVQKFYVAEGKVCAGLITHTLEAKQIRVLITTTDFASRFHDKVIITCQDDFKVKAGEKVTVYPAGQEVEFSLDSPEFAEGRVTIQANRDRFPLQVSSVTRACGTPGYLGTLELKKYEEGIVLLNDVFVEDYLMTVVPSEVPSTFHPEAINVQAITARTYACLAIQQNALWEYGAHVDDSENFQVYGNGAANSPASQAVRDTYGQILQYGEKPAVIYYFSTSCGATTGPEIWGGSLSEVPYMAPKWIGTEEKELDLRKEEDVKTYLSTVDETAYEKDCQWFRWSTEISLSMLSQSINGNLAKRFAVNPALILTKEGNVWVSKPIESVGDVLAVEVAARGSGGTVEKLHIAGSEGEILVEGQTNIRSLLGNSECIYETVTGTSDTYRSLLQSSFFYLEPLEDGYRIVGGGKGHGLGMPQNGMNQMAIAGMKAGEILQFFFAGTSVLTIY